MQDILIVEDDIHINELLKEALTKAGYHCQQAFSGTEARLLLEQSPYALVLLDLMLPGMTGEEVLRFIREKGSTPVMVLTAKDRLDDKVRLLTDGADDYITKPFEIQEVLARIAVQLRHSSEVPLSQSDHAFLTYGDIQLDKTNYEVRIKNAAIEHVTKQEFAILELLLRHPRKVFSKEEIFEYAWNEPYMGETKTLDVHISNIRKKIKEITPEEYIETVWGIGYRICQKD